MNRALTFNLLLVLLALAFAEESKENDSSLSPIVTVEEGQLQGLTLTSRKGLKYYGFLGVPYGKADIRFGSPQNADKWNGVRPATEKAPACFQFCLLEERLVGVENCLTLNVYSTQLDGTKKLAVMVLFHGGGFQFGRGSLHDAKYMVDEDIVLVTVNYRLGVLGFLNTEDGEVPGNNGLRDQSFALQWIQKNVEKFGGNKSKVTIFGYSAGGASVHYQMLSPMSKGLFSNAISQSGTALAPWALQQKPRELANRLATNVGCPSENSKELVECFRGKTPEELLNGQLQLSIFPHEFDFISMLFIPSVEKGDYEPKFLADNPYKLIVNGKTASKVPWMCGVANDEGAMYTASIVEDEKSMALINSKWSEMLPNILYYETMATPAEWNEISTKVWKFYFPDGKATKEDYLQLGRLYGDRFFVTPISRGIREHAKRSEFPVYPYIFNYTGSESIVKGLFQLEKDYGVSHGEDLKYLFNESYAAPDLDLESKDGQFSKRYIKFFATFAREGKPSGLWGGVKSWEPYVNTDDGKDIPWLVVSDDTKFAETDPFRPRTDFWEGLPLKEFEKEEQSVGREEL